MTSVTEEMIEALKPFAKLGGIILAEAPAEAKTVVCFTSATGEQHAMKLDYFRRARAALEAALSAAPSAPQPTEPVAVKPLEWRKPDDHPKDPDPDDNLLAADGLGGVYAISVRQKVGPAYLLWWAHDPMDWSGFDSIEEAKAAAQADYSKRILSALKETTNAA